MTPREHGPPPSAVPDDDATEHAALRPTREATPSDASALHNIGGWPSRWALRRPDALAVTDDERRLDWSAFEDRVARVAGGLRAAGIVPGDRVAFVLHNRGACLEVLLGAARIGAITLPVNLRLSAREIAYQLDDCRPVALFHEADRTDTIAAAEARARHTPALHVPVGAPDDRYEAWLDEATPVHEAIAVRPDDAAILMYTSGTTGLPKGALLPHRKSLFNSLNAMLDFGIRADDRVLVVAPIFHSLGLQILSLPVVHAGGALVIRARFDPEDVWQTVEREGITYFGGVPAMHQRLHDTLVAAGDTAPDRSTLRFVFTAGSAVSTELIRAFEKHEILLMQGYGQTESSTLCCLRPEDAVRKAGSVGRPVFHADVRVVALETREMPPERWRDVEPGESGEIVVRGPITMLGYWEKPEATAEALIEGWLCTGDLARVDEEGFVTLVGRSKDMIISGGENVYPAEVEAVYREHPSIREIAIVGEPDPKWGEVGRAHVLLEEAHTLDLDALEVWARERLAVFKLPRKFIVENELPRTASGKIRKHLLLDPAGRH